MAFSTPQLQQLEGLMNTFFDNRVDLHLEMKIAQKFQTKEAEAIGDPFGRALKPAN